MSNGKQFLHRLSSLVWSRHPRPPVLLKISPFTGEGAYPNFPPNAMMEMIDNSDHVDVSPGNDDDRHQWKWWWWWQGENQDLVFFVDNRSVMSPSIGGWSSLTFAVRLSFRCGLCQVIITYFYDGGDKNIDHEDQNDNDNHRWWWWWTQMETVDDNNR